MVLWTVQDAEVWRILQEEGSYTTPSSMIEFPAEEDTASYHAHYAYRWMAGKMRELVGPPPDGVEFPVWAWYKQQGRADGKPDMRSEYLEPGRLCVRMRLDVPDWEVLLTDFSDWNHALNYWYLSESEADEAEFDAWRDSLGVSFHDVGDWGLQSPQLALVRERVESSWDRMLGVRPADGEWHFPWRLRSFQATFWELRPEHVLSVEEFGPR